MTVGRVILTSPWTWVTATALFLGLAAAVVSWSVKRSPDPDRTAARKGVLAPLAAAAAVASATAGLFLAGFPAHADPHLAIYGGAVLLVGFFAFRFPAYIGLPVLFLASALVILGHLALAPWTPVGEGSVPMVIRVLALGEEIEVELISSPAAPELEELRGLQEIPGSRYFAGVPGSSLEIDVELVTVHPAWFFLGRHLAARPMVGADEEMSGLSNLVVSGSIPGIESGQVRIEISRPALLRRYALVVRGGDLGFEELP